MADSFHSANADASRVQGHTPGPWTINEHGTILANGHTLLVTGVGLASGPADSVAQERANARLIAAAPELLEALIAERDALTALDRLAAFNKTAAAIAKATGAA